MAKTTTFYIKCSAEEAAAIRAAAKKELRTIHNWLRVVVLADAMKEEGSRKRELEFGICPDCRADGKRPDTPMAHRSGSGKLMPGHKEGGLNELS